MSDVVIRVEDLGKYYRLGQIGGDTLREDLHRWWAEVRGKDTLPVEFEGSGHSARQDGEIWALRDVNFEVRQGVVVGIIGRNGAGKSTLLKILSRITAPTRGRIRIRGRVASLLEVGTGFHPDLTGRENVFLNGAILGMKRAEIQRKLEEIVAFAEIGQFLDTPVKRYSSGMYVRLAFAVAAHLDSEILIVDEVLAVGDAHFQKKCVERMAKAGLEGRTVLFVSHNMGVIHALCSECILFAEGRIATAGETLRVINEYNAVGSKQGIVEITPQMRNRGNGSVTLETCGLSDASGNVRNTFHIGEEIRVHFNLSSRFSGSASFWLIIFDAVGNPLLSTHQRDEELVQLSPGSYSMTYTTEAIGLMPGEYTIAAGAFDAKLNFLEWIDNCQSFEIYSSFVNGTSFDGRWGKVNQRAEWQLERRG